jgi:DNA-binding PadR family transcriptional regulator
MALSHAILAALTECPCSGYDLAKRFDGSVGFFWHASHQQIYRELTKLEDQGLIRAEVIAQTSRPDKKLFHVTPAGTECLQAWMAQPTKGSPLKDELLVKLFVGYLVPPDTLITTLQQGRSQHAATLAAYQAIEQQYFADADAISPAGQFQYLTLRNGIHYETAWLAWCDEALTTLNAMEDASDSP